MESNKKLFDFKNHNLRVFLAFLVVTALISFLIKLTKTYTESANVALSYVNLPEGKIIQQASTQEAVVRMRAQGYYFLRFSMWSPTFEIDLSEVRNQSGNRYYYLLEENLDRMDTRLKGIEPLSMQPDTLWFTLDELVTKKLPVASRIELDFASGYDRTGEIELVPDSLFVSGPRGLMDTLEAIPTKQLQQEEVRSALQGSLDIDTTGFGPHVSAEVYTLNYTVQVDKFTEAEAKVPVELINVPEDQQLKIFPKEVRVKYRVAVEQYNTILANNFKVVCDFEEADTEGSFMIPRVVSAPEGIQDYRVLENRIQYILVK
ncbi:hypothetical protein [Croceiramulus getboli]|nr:hypothetical protein P8624_14200 [Flavobacteriaceae bacterium YJPT1-3]